MAPVPCPSPKQLQQLLQGQLPDEQSDVLERHLSECPPCAQTVQSLRVDDTLQQSLRAGADAVRRAEQAVPPDLLAKVQVLPGKSATHAVTIAPEGDPEARAEERFDFLAPPQAAGELGRLKHFRVLKVLGQGGMGVVFQGEDTRLHRPVALKAILPEVARKPGATQRFLREARTAANVEHDNIVAIYHVDEERGVPFIAMPLLKGMSLDEWLKRKEAAKARVSLAQIRKIGREIAKGLGAAHERGLIHRDIKPANIWLDASAGGRVKILDFGLARATTGEQNITQSGVIIGTPSYMAPEQAQSMPIDGRADLFSLGVVLYRLCTGELPFKGQDMMATLMALAMHEPPPPSALNPAIPPGLSELVMKLIAKDPTARPATAKEVAAALQALEGALPAAQKEEAAELSMPAAVPVAPGPASLSNPFADLSATPTPAKSVQGRPAPPVAKRGLPRNRRTALIAALAGLGVVIVAGIVFFMQTPNGWVRFEINDDAIKVQIDKDESIITGADTEPIKLKPGKHGMTIKRGTFSFDTTTFVLKKGETTTLKVDWLPGKAVVVVQDGKEIGKLDLPPMRVVDAKTPETGPHSLVFDGKTSYVKIPSLKYDGGPITIEARIFPAPKDAAVLVAGGGKGSVSLFVGGIHGLGFSAGAMGQGQSADWGKWPGGKTEPVHVAGVWDGKEIRCYVEGKLARKNPRQEYGKEFPGFFIGGMPGFAGFEGTIAEVRISNVARYDKDFKPRERFVPDDKTLGLYHCDDGQGDVLKDSSGNEQHGTIVGAKWGKVEGTSPANYAVRMSGSGVQLDTSSISLKGRSTWTVEAWLTPREPAPRGGEAALVLMVDPVWMAQRSAAKWAIGGPTLRPGSTIFASGKIEAGKPVHLAMSRGPQGASFFVNGVRQGEPLPIAFAVGQSWLRVCPMGNPKARDVGFHGDIDELRVSSVERYQGNFIPQPRYEVDGDTLALYHFDEGKGEVFKDSSGNEHHGKIVGATWVKTDGTPSPAFTNALGMEFALVPKGKAWLGGGGGKVGDKEVEFKDDFYLGVYEVTQEEWANVMGNNPSHFSRDGAGKDAIKTITDAELKRFPVEKVSWDDAQRFIVELNKRAIEPGWIYRLPKETEWEYACRGGAASTKSEYGFDFYFEKPTNELLPNQANFDHAEGLKRTCPVGSYKPNRLGLHDMHGNVWEWCDNLDNKGARMIRGGRWDFEASGCRAATLGWGGPDARDKAIGLRVARVRIGDVPPPTPGNPPEVKTLLKLRDFDGHKEEVNSVGFSADGRLAITGSRDKTAAVWNVETGKRLAELVGHSEVITCVALSSDGRLALTGSEDKTVGVWEVKSGRNLQFIKAHAGIVRSVAFAPDDRRAVSGGEDHAVYLLSNLEAVTAKSQKLAGHTDKVTSVAFSTKGDKVLSGGWDATPRLWDATTGQPIRQFTGHKDWVQAVAISPDGKRALTGSGGGMVGNAYIGKADCSVRLWDVETGEELKKFTGDWGGISCAGFLSDGRHIFFAEWAARKPNPTFHVWDTANGWAVARWGDPTGSSVVAGAVSSDGKYALVGRAFNAGGHAPLLRLPDLGLDQIPLVGGVIKPATAWVGYRGSASFNAASGLEPVPPLKKLWQTPLRPSQAPACVADRLYVPVGNKVHAVDCATGKILWNSADLGEITSFPVVAPPKLYVGCGAKLCVLSCDTGQVVTTKEIEASCVSLFLDGDALYVGTSLGVVLRLKAQDLTKTWQAGDGKMGEWNLIHTDSSVSALYRWSTRRFTAINKDGGSTAWELPMEAQNPWMMPVLYKGAVVGHFGGQSLKGLDALSGKVLWEEKTGDHGPYAPWKATYVLTDDGLLVWGDYGGSVSAFDLTTHKMRWSRPQLTAGQGVLETPCVTSQFVYVVTGDSILHVLSRPTGASVFTRELPGFGKYYVYSPIVHQGRLLLFGPTIQCFGAEAPVSQASPVGTQAPKFINPLGMEFALVPKGKAWLNGTSGKAPDDMPTEFKEDFYLGVYEVTQADWRSVMGNNPSGHQRNGKKSDVVKDIPEAELDRFPVETVSYNDAKEFIARLNEKVKQEGWTYRLPTLDEWQYACRGGPMEKKEDQGYDYYFDRPTNVLLPDRANFERHVGRPKKVGSYLPNLLGLYDMHGNVGEWCDDTRTDPDGSVRVMSHGGSWTHPANWCRAVFQIRSQPFAKFDDMGFRLARVPVGKKAPRDLLGLVNLDRDVVKGAWKLGPNRLASDGGVPYCRLKLPYRPPAEYDFKVEFTAQGGNDILQILAAGDRSFTWLMGGWGGKWDGFDAVAGHPFLKEGTNIIGGPSSIQRGKRHVSVIEVRQGSIAGRIDGRLVVQHKTDFSDLSVPPPWAIGAGVLGLGTTFDATVFHKVEVVEISGPGQVLGQK